MGLVHLIDLNIVYSDANACVLIYFADIQSETRESKRRFTDFVFQRVVPGHDAKGLGGGEGPADAARATADDGTSTVKGARSIDERSTRLGSPISSIPAQSGPSIPVVRATAPGAEFEELRRLGAAKGKGSGELKASIGTIAATTPEKRSASLMSPVTSPSNVMMNAVVRRFHITAPVPDDQILRKMGGGVQKKKGPKHAVVVEQKGDFHRPMSVHDFTNRPGSTLTGGDDGIIKAEDVLREIEMAEAKSSVTPRKRRVVNDAERRWREQSNMSRYIGRMQSDYDRKKKTGTSMKDDPSTWDLDSAELAEELEQAALQAIRGENVEPPTPEMTEPELYVPAPKRALKFKPHLPKNQRGDRNSPRKGPGRFDGADDAQSDDTAVMATTTTEPTAIKAGLEDVSAMRDALEAHVVQAKKETDDEADYVYDVFIRRPAEELLDDPRLAQFQNGLWSAEDKLVPTNIGVVVISDKDVHYWDALAEEDNEDKDWNTEDEDSNGEFTFSLVSRFEGHF